MTPKGRWRSPVSREAGISVGGVAATVVNNPGTSFTVSCSPSASIVGIAGGTNYAGGVSFVYAAAAVTMSVGGTTPDPKAGDDLLTGQQCSASLVGVPSSPAYSTTYAWSVSAGGGTADVFKTYNVQAAANPLVLLSAADLTGAGLSFYDKKQETIVIQCKATISAADGKTSQVVTVQSQPISVLKPSVTAWGITGGIVRVNNSAGTFGFLGLPGDHIFVDGQSWHDVSLNVPAPFAGGQFCFAQLITLDLKYYRTLLAGSTASSFYQVKNNGIKGLDSGFPYLHQWTLPNQPVNVSLDVDSPQALIPGLGSTIPVNDTGGSRWNQVVATENFTTWLMYMPATTGAVWIPLQSYSWNWSGTEQDTDTNPDDPPSWSFMAGTPSSRLTYTGVNTDTPPTWTIIHSNSDPIGPP